MNEVIMQGVEEKSSLARLGLSCETGGIQFASVVPLKCVQPNAFDASGLTSLTLKRSENPIGPLGRVLPSTVLYCGVL